MPLLESETILEMDAHIPSARGLICAYNVRGQSLDLSSLKKWVRLCAIIHKADKVDIRFRQAEAELFSELLAFQFDPGLRCSARIAAGEFNPALLEVWKFRGLWDLCLEVEAPDWDALRAWVDTANKLNVTVRVELLASTLGKQADADEAADILCRVQAVNLCAYATLAAARGYQNSTLKPAHLENAWKLADKLRAGQVECNLINFPFCAVPESLRGHCENGQQLQKNHQYYIPQSLHLATTLYGLKAHAIDKVLEIELGRQTSWHSQIDSLVLPWILRHPSAYVRVWMIHKLFRHLHLHKKRPKPLPETQTQVDAAILKLRDEKRRTLGPVCMACRFQDICDHRTETFRAVAPDFEIQAQAGEVLLDPLALFASRTKFYDTMDAARRDYPKQVQDLAKEALRISLQTQPTREIPSDSYDGDGHHCHHMPGTVRWYSFENIEVMSTPLARVEAPFTMSVTFGGGIAQQIGISFGRHAKLVCPMIAHTHKLILHVDGMGHYALLRDGMLVRPTEFLSHRLLPVRLGGVLEPQLSMWNIDGQICSQNILIWEDVPAAVAESKVRFSVLLVSTRYTRRLQAVMLGLAHQIGIAPGELEVAVAYVPGIDATDDLLDSMALAYPHLRIIRSPFPRYHVRSKGFMINETAKVCSGEWVALLDSDIVLPPDFFSRLAQENGGAHYCAPDGRKMLPADTTAQILLGVIRPWESYEALLAGEGPSRLFESEGVPPGFCQCVRRDVFKSVSYTEFEHFEGADWEFSRQVMEKFGGVTRLSGMQVLHLDHQGSQWYGTEKQM